MRIRDLDEGAWDSFKQGFNKTLGTSKSFSAKKETPLARIDPRVLKLVLRDVIKGTTLKQDQIEYLQSIYKQL